MLVKVAGDNSDHRSGWYQANKMYRNHSKWFTQSNLISMLHIQKAILHFHKSRHRDLDRVMLSYSILPTPLAPCHLPPCLLLPLPTQNTFPLSPTTLSTNLWSRVSWQMAEHGHSTGTGPVWVHARLGFIAGPMISSQICLMAYLRQSMLAVCSTWRSRLDS